MARIYESCSVHDSVSSVILQYFHGFGHSVSTHIRNTMTAKINYVLDLHNLYVSKDELNILQTAK